MSATFRDLRFGITVADPDQWSPEHRAACEATGPDAYYDDWVVEQLTDAMRAAGQRWIDEHRDLFRSRDLI